MPETCWSSITRRRCATSRGCGATSLAGRPAIAVDDWIRMVCLNRLTGHSAGFFSVYTLPPNQAVSVRRAAQDQRSSARRCRRSATCRRSSCKKSQRCSLKDAAAARSSSAAHARMLTGPADRTPEIAGRQRRPGRHLAALPRRGGIRRRQLAALLVRRHRRRQPVPITMHRSLTDWEALHRAAASRELARVLRPGGMSPSKSARCAAARWRWRRRCCRAATGLPLDAAARS